MRYWTLAVAVVAFSIMSCSDSTGPANDRNTDDNDTKGSTEEVIGRSGGLISIADAAVDIPVGAFSEPASLVIKRVSNNEFQSTSITDTFEISGIPSTFEEPLEIRLKYSGVTENTIHVAVGTEGFVTSVQQNQVSFTFYPAILDDDYIIAVIDPFNESDVLARSAQINDRHTITLMVKATGGHSPYTTLQGHFKITYQSGAVSSSSIENLGSYLEEAYDLFDSMGFAYTARTSWPISVTVKKLANSNAYGYHVCSKLGLNNSVLEFNADKINDTDQVKTTAVHELFHFVQELYDPRFVWSRVISGGDKLWLEEACSVWSEEKFSDDPNYVSVVRQGNETAPFLGMYAPAVKMAAQHGYGMSAMIKYLTEKYSESILPNIFEEIKAEKHPVDAVINSTEEPEVWWEEFIREYTLGNIYQLDPSLAVGQRTDQFYITTENDTLHTFVSDYVDLSARIFLIRLDRDDLDPSASLQCDLTGSNAKVTIFRYRGSPKALEYVTTTSSTTEIRDLKNLHEQGWHLLAVVSHHGYSKPYTNTTPISLQIKIKQAKQPGIAFNHVSIIPSLHGHFTTSWGDETDENVSLYSFSSDGSLDGREFSGSFQHESNGLIYEGDITCVFNESFETMEYVIFGGTVSKTESHYVFTLTFTGQDFEYYEDVGQARSYRITGSQFPSHLTFFESRLEWTTKFNDEYWKEVSQLTPDDDYYIILRFE